MKEVHLQSQYKKTNEVILKKLGDSHILIPIQQSNPEVAPKIFAVNKMGVLIWRLIDGYRTLKEIRDIILETYTAKEEMVEKDLVRFIKKLESIKAIKL